MLSPYHSVQSLPSFSGYSPRHARRGSSVGFSPTRQWCSPQPVAIGAARGGNESPKHPDVEGRESGSASGQAVTQVNAAQAPRMKDVDADLVELQGRPPLSDAIAVPGNNRVQSETHPAGPPGYSRR